MIMSVLEAIDRAIALICKCGVIFCLLALFFLLFTAVVVRMVPVLGISGYDEVVEWLFVWLTFLGAVALWREGALYRVVLIELAVPRWGKIALGLLAQLCMLLFALVLTIKGYEFLRYAGETTPFLRIDKGYWYAALPVTGTVMVAYSVAGLWRILRGGDAFSTTTSSIE
jgi:TRAP-type C4-dicarboxylate transport system permease small subunit